MTNKDQLRNQFEKDKGVRCITPKGDGDIRYVEFLESEIEKMDKDYRHRIIQLLDKAIERDEEISELRNAKEIGANIYRNLLNIEAEGRIQELEIANKMYEEDLKIKEAESGRETAP